MKTLLIAIAGLLAIAASCVDAADSGSRTYGDPSCSDRNASSQNCVIQDGPSRRGNTAAPSADTKDASGTRPANPSSGTGSGSNPSGGMGSSGR